MDYTGYPVSGSRITTMRTNVKAIQDAPFHKNSCELQSFLVLLNCNGRCVLKLSTILKPLTLLLHDEVPWNWSPDCNERFNELKVILSGAPVLAHFDPKLPLILS